MLYKPIADSYKIADYFIKPNEEDLEFENLKASLPVNILLTLSMLVEIFFRAENSALRELQKVRVNLKTRNALPEHLNLGNNVR